MPFLTSPAWASLPGPKLLQEEAAQHQEAKEGCQHQELRGRRARGRRGALGEVQGNPSNRGGWAGFSNG